LAAFAVQTHARELVSSAQSEGSAMRVQGESSAVHDLLKLRDEAFEKRRLELFAQPGFAAELQRSISAADRVDGFAIRVLLKWLTQAPASYAELERFIVVEEPELSKKNRTAVGNDSSTNLLRVIGKQNDLPGSLDYLLFRALTRPHAQPDVHGALGRYFAQKPIHEPEVWIRMTVEINDAEISRHAAEQVLVLADKARTLAALRLERTRLATRNLSLPAALEAMRVQLSGAKQ
jgi:hypothetical protein